MRIRRGGLRLARKRGIVAGHQLAVQIVEQRPRTLPPRRRRKVRRQWIAGDDLIDDPAQRFEAAGIGGLARRKVAGALRVVRIEIAELLQHEPSRVVVVAGGERVSEREPIFAAGRIERDRPAESRGAAMGFAGVHVRFAGRVPACRVGEVQAAIGRRHSACPEIRDDRDRTQRHEKDRLPVDETENRGAWGRGVGVRHPLPDRLLDRPIQPTTTHSQPASTGSGRVMEELLAASLRLCFAEYLTVSIISASVRGKRILVVEDDADLRRLFRMALSVAGYDVDEAGDGLDALKIIENRPPDLVVLDLVLRALDGVSVRQELAAQSLTRHIPIVVVTGSTVDAGALDVACVLRKPIMPDELLRAVATCLAAPPPAASA